MDDENKSQPETTASFDWYGLQLIMRMKGTNELELRSFPFWAPSVEFAIDHAKKTNKLHGHEKTFWTHVLVLSKVTETKTTSQTHPMEQYEVAI